MSVSKTRAFTAETAARCNTRRHIIYVKFGDKFSPQRWPDPGRGTFEGISLIGHKIGTEGPPDLVSHRPHGPYGVCRPIRLMARGASREKERQTARERERERERVRSPFAYNGLNYVHTRLAAPTFLCRTVRKRAHEAGPPSPLSLPPPPSPPPHVHAGCISLASVYASLFSPLFLPSDLPTRAENTHNIRGIGRGERSA